MCNLILAGESFSGISISVAIQGHLQGQMVNFKGIKCKKQTW